MKTKDRVDSGEFCTYRNNMALSVNTSNLKRLKMDPASVIHSEIVRKMKCKPYNYLCFKLTLFPNRNYEKSRTHNDDDQCSSKNYENKAVYYWVWAKVHSVFHSWHSYRWFRLKYDWNLWFIYMYWNVISKRVFSYDMCVDCEYYMFFLVKIMENEMHFSSFNSSLFQEQKRCTNSNKYMRLFSKLCHS